MSLCELAAVPWAAARLACTAVALCLLPGGASRARSPPKRVSLHEHTVSGCLQDEDVRLSLPQLAATPWGAASLACEALALAGMAPFLYIEAATLREYGLRGWVSAWNVMDIIAYAVQARPPHTVCLARRISWSARDFSLLGQLPLATSQNLPACVSLCACVQIVIAVMHLGRLRLASNTLSVLVAFQVLLLWVKAQYFARRGPLRSPAREFQRG